MTIHKEIDKSKKALLDKAMQVTAVRNGSVFLVDPAVPAAFCILINCLILFKRFPPSTAVYRPDGRGGKNCLSLRSLQVFYYSFLNSFLRILPTSVFGRAGMMTISLGRKNFLSLVMQYSLISSGVAF
jgi:hypothetical protein